MAVRSQEILNVIQRQITGQDLTADVQNVGQVIEVGDGIARIWGLSECAAGELLEFPGGPGEPSVMGLALNLEEETIGCVILGPYTQIQEGNEVRRTGRIAQVPVGDALVSIAPAVKASTSAYYSLPTAYCLLPTRQRELPRSRRGSTRKGITAKNRP